MNWKNNTIMLWDGQKISDHARSSLDVSYDVMERKQRMAGGTLRKMVIARKLNISCSWEMFPSNGDDLWGPVDGGLSGREMLNFYETRKAFEVVLRDGAGRAESRLCMISDFSYEVVKRAKNTDYWDISVTLEEV